MAMSTDIPLFEGFVDTTMDALRLIEVCLVLCLATLALAHSNRLSSFLSSATLEPLRQHVEE